MHTHTTRTRLERNASYARRCVPMLSKHGSQTRDSDSVYTYNDQLLKRLLVQVPFSFYVLRTTLSIVKYISQLSMRLCPTARGQSVTHSGERCPRTPSLAYLNCVVDGGTPQSGRCIPGSAPLALHLRTVKGPVNCLNFSGSEAVYALHR
jgi:hypothetical protein